MTLLRTGTPVPSPDRFGPCTVVEAGDQKFIDACRGATIRLYHCAGAASCHAAAAPLPGVIMLDAFVQGLHELSYAKGRNLILERRYAEWRPERLRELGTNSSRIPSVWAAARVSCSNVAMVRSL